MILLRLSTEHKAHTKNLIRHYKAWPSIALLRGFESDLLGQMYLEPPVLDLACGDGLISSYAFTNACFAGCDIDISRLSEARKQKRYFTLTSADGRALPYADHIFGSVVSNSSLEHIVQVDSLIYEVFRVLRPGGTFIFTVPNTKFNDWFWLNWLLTKFGLKNCGSRVTSRFNEKREHVNLWDICKWEKQLAMGGFLNVDSGEYFPFTSTLIFSLLETVWLFPARIPLLSEKKSSVTKTSLAAMLLFYLPWGHDLQFLALKRFMRQRSEDRGSHLLIIAQKCIPK